ncbi:MAG: hypothetical protein JXR83_21405 [Deltaproteobacteria bacterium]|nr:hypothetical protein [Deltaproteobacteria bacterium]
MTPFLRALVGILALAIAGCQETPEPTAREILIRPLFKPSCRTVCGSTCLACVDALLVEATDAEGGTLVESQCQDIRGKWKTLCDLTIGTRITALTGVPTRTPVVIKLWAYRNPAAPLPDAGVDGGPQCTAPAESDPWSCQHSSSDLMLWGRSRQTDLSPDAGAQWIEVEVECRAGCDCLDLGRKQSCPLVLPASACLSRSSDLRTLTCDKRCSSDQECFEGELRCNLDAGRCDPIVDNPTAPLPFCARCQHASDCRDNVCVGYAREDGGYGYCARSCPDNACPRGASCVPVVGFSGYQELL